MPSTHSSLHIHVVFSTKERLPFIHSEWKRDLHAFLGGCLKRLDAFPQEIEDPRTGYPRVLADKNFASKFFADGLADGDDCWSIQWKRTSARSNAIGPK